MKEIFSFISFRSHGLSLKNELILTMIEQKSDWERVLSENIDLFDEEVCLNQCIDERYNLKICFRRK